jgi:hypothetical protein
MTGPISLEILTGLPVACVHVYSVHVRLLIKLFIGVNPSEGALCAGLSNRYSLLFNIIGPERFVNRNRLAVCCAAVFLLSYTRLRAVIESLSLPVYQAWCDVTVR